jgi:TRAP transporter TAXI family solute receptor
MNQYLGNCKKIILIITTIFVSLSVQAADLGIVTGGKTGTYYQFGLDISRVVTTKNLNLTVHISKGSLANMYSVLKLPHAQLAIVQSDVLKFLSYSKNSEAKQMVNKTRLVFPLYNEEVHILAKSGVGGFADLEGRKVAIGGKGSGTFLTAKTLLKLAGINVESVYASGDKALNMLKKSEIDAMFYVAGYPVSLFENSVSVADDFKLLEITDKGVTEFYVPSKIPASAYPWMKDDVNLVAVKAVIMTFNYKGENCQNIYEVASRVRENLPELRRTGHRKWQEVDLDLKIGGWTKYGCLKDGKPSDPAVPWLESLSNELG